jgi:hypothetical protein
MPRAFEIGCGSTARRAASLDAALDVRAQGLSQLGRPAQLISACFGLPSLVPRALKSPNHQ